MRVMQDRWFVFALFMFHLFSYSATTSLYIGDAPIRSSPGGDPKRRLPKTPKTFSTKTTTAKAKHNGDNEQLSEKQAEALRLIENGCNVFITGVAGTGKSLLLKRAVRYLKRKHKPNQFVTVGPTGSSAVALEGQTLHSVAGIGIPTTWNDFDKPKKNQQKKKQWKNLNALVLDECSMISGEFFDLLSRTVSDIRKDPRPFGGIQLIVCGDFLQLPPIAPRKSDVEQITAALQEKEGVTQQQAERMMFLNRGFAFQAYSWQKANFKIIELDTVFRQKNQAFVHILNEIRRGYVTTETRNFLETKCARPLPPNEFGIQPTILHSKNRDVNRENLVELNKLEGETITFDALDTIEREKGAPKWAENQLKKSQFFSGCIAEKELKLKIGSQVMLIKNQESWRNLVNGSRGKVVGFQAVKEKTKVTGTTEQLLLPGVEQYPIVQFVSGVKKVIKPTTFQSRLLGLGTCTRLAIPLKLAWSITTHKAQGLTLDYVIADVGQVFAEAQTYVALSRASDENGLELRNFSPNRVRANPLALSFHEDPDSFFRNWDGGNRLPPLSEEEQRALDSDRSAKQRVNPRFRQGGTFVFAGTMVSMSRNDATSLVEKHGGIVRKSVSSKTDFLVIGPKMRNGKSVESGTEYKKALSVSNIQILSEEEFLELVSDKQ